MPGNLHKTRCQIPGCRNWAMCGHTHYRPRRDSELGPRGASAPHDNLNALRALRAGSRHRQKRAPLGTPLPAPGCHARGSACWPTSLLLNLERRRPVEKQLLGPSAWKAISGNCVLHSL
jgi:hypothetical protein